MLRRLLMCTLLVGVSSLSPSHGFADTRINVYGHQCIGDTKAHTEFIVYTAGVKDSFGQYLTGQYPKYYPFYKNCTGVTGQESIDDTPTHWPTIPASAGEVIAITYQGHTYNTVTGKWFRYTQHGDGPNITGAHSGGEPNGGIVHIDIGLKILP